MILKIADISLKSVYPLSIYLSIYVYHPTISQKTGVLENRLPNIRWTWHYFPISFDNDIMICKVSSIYVSFKIVYKAPENAIFAD